MCIYKNLGNKMLRMILSNADENGTIDYIQFILATMHRYELDRDEQSFKAVSIL